MSRANPIALRIASKRQSPMFIGVSQYYFYDHLKQNLNIFKLTGLVSKQIILPTNKLVKYKVNSDNLTVLTPHLLPINTACAVKHLFSTNYMLNKRRFSNTVLHYVSWLQDDFNTNYKRFNTSTGVVKYDKTYKLCNLSIAPIYLNDSKLSLKKQSSVKKSYTQFCCITKANQINDVYKYLFFNSSNNSMIYKSKPNNKFINCLLHLSSLALKCGVRLTRKPKIYIQTKEINLFDSKLLYMQNFKKMQVVTRNNLGLLGSSTAKAPVLKKIHGLCSSRPNYGYITNNMFLLAFLNLLYPQSKKHNSFAKQASFYQLSTRQQKSLLNREKSTQLTNFNNYIDSKTHRNLSTNYCYLISPYSGFKKLNESSFSKVQKHINLFSNTTKLLLPLELVIYRNFCEPAGLNYFTALENRLSKSRFNINLSSTLFKRTSKNGFIPNYTNTQTGLIRLKAQIIFEFLYTLSNQSKSVIEQKTNSNQQNKLDSGNSKLWLRKGSSIRI